MANRTLVGASGTYRVGNLLATTSAFRVYLAQEVGGQYCLLQVAASIEANGGLDRAAFLLQRFEATADVFDVEYAKTHERKHLHYDRLYPAVIESFVSPQQGGRRINVLALTDVDDIFRVVPLSNLRMKDRLRIDPETSAWIMGRLLKLLAFVHGEGVAHGSLVAKNVVLDPKNHFAITLDWSHARMFPSQVPGDIAALDIADAATAVFASIGGNTTTGTWPYEGHEAYTNLLLRLMFMRTSKVSTRPGGAERVMDQFYELVRSEYGRVFHPFTTLPL